MIYFKEINQKKITNIIFGGILILIVFIAGYVSFGIWPALIFLPGYLGGFLLWFSSNSTPSFSSIKAPYLITFILYILHLMEENLFGFHDMLSQLTGITSPGFTVSIAILMILSIGIWLIAPLLIKNNYDIGYFFAWTFFGAMGITELAHFLFPLFTKSIYNGGIITTIFLAPSAWWGMWLLANK